MDKTVHVPVLLQEIIDHIQLVSGSVVFDGTLGGGGYAERFAHIIGSSGLLVGTDMDSEAIERVKHKRLVSKTSFHNRPFSDVQIIAQELGILFDAAVLDLGLSSDQLDISSRGFSFKDPEQPLVMSFASEETAELTARDILNEWSEESIADILYGFGGERYSRSIARAVVAKREQEPFVRVGDLLEVIDLAVPAKYKHRKTHPATKTFQALRIVTNSEWQHVQEFLSVALSVLQPGGYVAIVSFHSGEDKVIKHTFRDWEQQGLGTRITKRPIKPSAEEQTENPRSRSALLRIFKKHY